METVEKARTWPIHPTARVADGAGRRASIENRGIQPCHGDERRPARRLVIGPSRRTRAGSTPGPPRWREPRRARGRRRPPRPAGPPGWRRRSARHRHPACPARREMLALVVNSGPAAAMSASATGWSGARKACVRSSAAAGRTRVRRARPERSGQRPRAVIHPPAGAAAHRCPPPAWGCGGRRAAASARTGRPPGPGGMRRRPRRRPCRSGRRPVRRRAGSAAAAASPSGVAGRRSVTGGRSCTTRSIPARSASVPISAGMGSSATSSRTASAWPAPISSSATPPSASRPGSSREQATDDGRGHRARRQARRGARSEAAGARPRPRPWSGTAGWRSPRRPAAVPAASGAPAGRRSPAPPGRPGRGRPGSRPRAPAPPAETSLAARRTRPSASGGAEALRQRHGHCPAAGGHLPGGDRLVVADQAGGDLVDGRLGQQLRLRTRDQRPAVHRDPQGEPLLEAADVGHRLPGRAALHPAASRAAASAVPAARPDARAARSGRVRRRGPPAARRPAAGWASRRRAGALLRPRPARGRGRRSRASAQSPSPPSPVACASRSAWSASASGSTTRSRSPSSSPGRLCTVRPMRWSVTRSSGKL